MDNEIHEVPLPSNGDRTHIRRTSLNDSIKDGGTFIASDTPTPLPTPHPTPHPNSHPTYISFDNLSQAPTIENTPQQIKTISLAPPPKFMLTKFTIYETKTKMYIVGSNSRESRFKLLEIDLTAPKDQLIINEKTPTSVNRSGIIEILSNVEKDADSNKSGFGNNGLTKRLTAWAILGFIRFTEGYYISVVTKRSIVALIGGHFIYHIESTELIPITHSSNYRKPDRRSDEARLMNTFLSLDLSRTFYYSNTYDITHTLQYNMIREKETILGLYNEPPSDRFGKYNERFLWNIQLLEPVRNNSDGILGWCTAIIHGFIDQAKISVCGRNILVIILARRSRYFAGARFLKRGVNDQGNVANEVETEQIVCDHLTTSLHDPKDGLFNCPRYTSYVQHRGSIPLYWTQDVSKNMTPKPPIELNAIDPFFTSAGLHFDNMFRRYGSPLLILNLIKTRERLPRETKLLGEFEQCIAYLNQFLPEESKMLYTSWDMSRASKSRDQEVIEFLENYAEKTLKKTGFFHNGKNLNWLKIQDGICRTNCIDCLDRTNAAQFVIGKKALGYQLYALGITNTTNIEYDSDVVNLLTEMYHDHGDTIALQYGGSHLVNTMETYRKINQWTSHSRDMIESIRRFYSNSFVDSQRQDAINLFLGNFVWNEGQPNLWDLSTDYYLHNDFFVRNKPRRSYLKWWIPGNLLPINTRLNQIIDKIDIENEEFEPLLPYGEFIDNYWNEYYRPRTLTSLKSTFAYNMNSTLRYLPVSKNNYLSSPFISRKPVFEEKDKDSSNQQQNKSKSKSRLSSRTVNIRKEAMKRASMIYQTPTFISERVFSGRATKVENEEVNKSSRSHSNSISISSPRISMDTFEENTFLQHDIVSFTQNLLDPNVSPNREEKYNEHVKNDLQFETDILNSTNTISPDEILSNLKVSDQDYKIYEYYYKLSHLDKNPKSGKINKLEQYSPIYQDWLSLKYL